MNIIPLLNLVRHNGLRSPDHGSPFQRTAPEDPKLRLRWSVLSLGTSKILRATDIVVKVTNEQLTYLACRYFLVKRFVHDNCLLFCSANRNLISSKHVQKRPAQASYLDLVIILATGICTFCSLLFKVWLRPSQTLQQCRC